MKDKRSEVRQISEDRRQRTVRQNGNTGTVRKFDGSGVDPGAPAADSAAHRLIDRPTASELASGRWACDTRYA